MSRNHAAVFACILALTGVATTARPNPNFFDDGNDAGWVRSQPRTPFGALKPSNVPGRCRIQATSSPNPALVGPGLLLVTDVTTPLPDGPADAAFDKVPAEAIPEPRSPTSLAAGLVGLFGCPWRRKRAKGSGGVGSTAPSCSRRRVNRKLQVEELESRVLPTLNPFDSSIFQAQIQELMLIYNLPQISFAVERGTESFTYAYANEHFFGPSPPVTTSNSLFRLGSISKAFTAAAIMRLVQDGHLQLSTPAYQALGYFDGNGNPRPVSGYDPLDGQTPVSVTPSNQGDGSLLNVTIQNLLNMSSGLPLDVPVRSLTWGQGAITDATNTRPIVITSNNHNLSTGDTVLISGVMGNTAANGTHRVTVLDANTFCLDDSSGNGPYTGGGTWEQPSLDQPPIYTPGSYASLAFAGAFRPSTVPYVGPPAGVYQQLDYYVYAYTQYDLDLSTSGTYVYSDIGYAVLGAVAETVSQRVYGLSYGEYLQTYILGPMGISPPSASPPPSTPIVAIGRTLAAHAFPTEVSYFSNPSEPDAPSIFPDSTVTLPPFYPPTRVPQPYGGKLYVQSHFGEGGLVATPLALTRFFNNLYAAYNGDTSGPLQPATVQQMVSQDFGTPVNASSWWGLGWQVWAMPGTATTPGQWNKNGGLPGTSALLVKRPDGFSWAFVLNEDVGDAVGPDDKPFAQTVAGYVNAAIDATLERTGVFRPGAGTWFLNQLQSDYSAATTTQISFGQAGDIPVRGDWLGDGVARVGVFRYGTWFLDAANQDYSPTTTIQIAFGQAGDVPVVGEWLGAGVARVGVFRPSTGTWYLDTASRPVGSSTGYSPLTTIQVGYGLAGDLPVVGQWLGDGTDHIGVFRPGTGT